MLCARSIPPGVLAYEDGTVVGWCGAAPRAEPHASAHSRRFPHADDLPVWSAWCFRVRGGHRGRGVARALLEGAVEHAREHGAPAVAGCPVDNGGRKVGTTMVYAGPRPMSEHAGFTWAADTASVLNGFPRVVMRPLLR